MKINILNKKTFLILLLIIFFTNLGFRIYSFKNEYTTRYDAKYWEQRYLHSQWVVPNSKESIGDDGLYAFVGWKYIHGSDPSLLNAEMPPFGKYLIGLSEVIFDNQNIFALICGLLVLASLFLLNRIIFKETILAIIPVMLLSADSLFYNQLKAPYLDTLYLGLLLLTFIFILKDKYFLANIFIGLTIASKSSLSSFIIIVSVILFYLFYMQYKKQMKKFLIYLPVSILIFLFTYLRFFLLGHSPLDFLKLQKWILAFYETGAKGNPTAVWQILFTGKWPNWFGPVQIVNEWTILWTFTLLAAFFYFYKVFPKHRKYKSTLLGIWVIAYLLFLTFIPVWPRYLLLVLPFTYTLTVWVISKKIPFFKSLNHP